MTSSFLTLLKADAKSNKRFFFLSFLTACLFCLCLPINALNSNHDYMPYQPTPLLLLGITVFSVVFYVLFRLLAPLRRRANTVDIRTRLAVRLALYGVAPVVAAILSCFALYPGIFSIDSLSQLEQAMGVAIYNDWHPVGHTLLFFTIPYTLTGQIFSVTVTHLLFYCFSWSYLFSTIETMGFKRKWLIPVECLLVFIPTNLFLSMAMWKDIPFTCAGAMLTVNFIRLYRDRALIKKTPFLIGTGVLMGLFMILRHNGPIIVPVLLAAFLLFYRKSFARALIPVCITLAMFAGSRFFAAGIVHAKPNPPAISFRWFTQIAGGILADGGVPTEEERAKLETIMPMASWAKQFDPYLNDPMLNAPGINVRENIGHHTRELIEATVSLALRYPFKALNAELRITELTWRILPNGPVNVISYKNRLDSYGLQIKHTPLFTFYHDAMETVRTTDVLSIFLTHQGLYFFLTVFLFCLALLRRQSWRALLCFFPVLLNVMSLWISIPSQDYRYVYLTVMAFPVLLCFSLAPEKVSLAAGASTQKTKQSENKENV